MEASGKKGLTHQVSYYIIEELIKHLSCAQHRHNPLEKSKVGCVTSPLSVGLVSSPGDDIREQNEQEINCSLGNAWNV